LRRSASVPRLDEVSRGPNLVYTVRDRSLLLPFYKRLFVEPALPFIPARVDPNFITHVGHAINLAGLVALLTLHSNWRFAIAALCLQIYNFCDNADGAHARRVNRCSALGELLDHGLDMLNTTYIAFIAAIAIGAPPPWFSAIAIVIPAACAATYWEQAETGVFNLGLLNQIESVFLLTTVLLVAAVFGTEIFAGVPRLVVMGFVVATALFGIVRNVFRARSRALHVAPLLLLDAAAFVASATGAVPPILAVIAATAGNVFFGVRCLALRTDGKKPTNEPGMMIVAGGIFAFIAAAALHHPASNGVAALGAAFTALFFAVYSAMNARVALRAVTRSR
jgi:phosphatidylglycerophosphate synthase